MSAEVGDKHVRELIERAQVYHKDADVDLLRRAFTYAKEKHEGQFRLSGEPYIVHPLAVATILTELEMDDETIAAGLLHDVIEDCGVTRDHLAAEFGPEIADLVDGVTKLKLADFEQREQGKAALPESVGQRRRYGGAGARPRRNDARSVTARCQQVCGEPAQDPSRDGQGPPGHGHQIGRPPP